MKENSNGSVTPQRNEAIADDAVHSVSADPDSPGLVYSGETDDPIEQRLALNTDCRTIVIADFAVLQGEPLFTLDGYAAYELEEAEFDALDAAGTLKNAVYCTNYDGADEKILLALRPQNGIE